MQGITFLAPIKPSQLMETQLNVNHASTAWSANLQMETVRLAQQGRNQSVKLVANAAIRHSLMEWHHVLHATGA